MSASRTRGVVVSVLLALLLSGCGVFGSNDASSSHSASPSASPSSSPSGSSSGDGSSSPAPEVTGALGRFYGQHLDWSACGVDQCAKLRVPLDYAKPRGSTIELALLKVPATDRADRIGSMVVDPGGPGGSGVEYAQNASTAFGAAIRKVYDVVGFDPRGVGRSDPLTCATDHQLDAFIEADPEPDTAAERRTYYGELRSLGEGCLRRSPGIAKHMSTVEVARDLDVLRAALGDRQLTYFGASYGTFIGATYASLFPKRVGRLVLDGALDPASNTVELNLGQARGFEVALRSYVAACVAKGSCYLGSSLDAGMRRIQRFLAAVDKHPLHDGKGADVGSGLAFLGIGATLYNKSYWPILDRALQTGFTGDPSVLRALAYAQAERSQDGKFQNLLEVLNNVSCLDNDKGVAPSKVASLLPRFEKASPTFGATFAYSTTTCNLWPIKSGHVAKALDVSGTKPILVVGTTRDPATPLIWAQALVKQLHDSRLVTRDGDGHTGYRQGSTCVDDIVESYLVSGKVPSHNVTCSH